MKYYVLSDDPEVYSDCPSDAFPLLCVQHCMTMAIDCHYPTTPGKVPTHDEQDAN